MKNIEQFIREKRVENNFTLEDVATYLGLERRTYGKKERKSENYKLTFEEYSTLKEVFQFEDKEVIEYLLDNAAYKEIDDVFLDRIRKAFGLLGSMMELSKVSDVPHHIISRTHRGQKSMTAEAYHKLNRTMKELGV